MEQAIIEKTGPSNPDNFFIGRKDLMNTNADTKWKLLMNSDTINKYVQKCADYINTNFEGKDIVLTCVLKGAVYFFVALSQKLIIPHSCYFIEASSYKDKQTQDEQVEILSKVIPSKFAGKTVVLIDELYDNGNTMANVKKHVHMVCNVPNSDIFTCVLFLKKKNGSMLDDSIQIINKPDLYGVVVPNVWCVGYGLDNNQIMRGWTNLYACPKAEGIDPSEDDALFTDNALYQKIIKKLTVSVM